MAFARDFLLKIALLSETYTYYTMMRQKMSNELTSKSTDIFHETTLADVGVGQSCLISECNLPSKVKARFAEMGLVPATVVTVLRVAPLGDPIVIRARGYELCLRKETARQFIIRLI